MEPGVAVKRHVATNWALAETGQYLGLRVFAGLNLLLLLADLAGSPAGPGNPKPAHGHFEPGGACARVRDLSGALHALGREATKF